MAPSPPPRLDPLLHTLMKTKDLCSKLLDWLSYKVFLVNINSHQLEKEYKNTQNGIHNGPKQWMKFE